MIFFTAALDYDGDYDQMTNRDAIGHNVIVMSIDISRNSLLISKKVVNFKKKHGFIIIFSPGTPQAKRGTTQLQRNISEGHRYWIIIFYFISTTSAKITVKNFEWWIFNFQIFQWWIFNFQILNFQRVEANEIVTRLSTILWPPHHKIHQYTLLPYRVKDFEWGGGHKFSKSRHQWNCDPLISASFMTFPPPIHLTPIQAKMQPVTAKVSYNPCYKLLV